MAMAGRTVGRMVSVVAGLIVAASTTALGQTVPPSGARYTLVLLNFEGPTHIRDAKSNKDYIEKATGLKGLYIVHSENQSTLYYGYYKAVSEREDAAEARRAKADLDKLSAIEVNGERPFAGALLIGLPTPDPDAPPEWDIRNSHGVYSLEIASYRDAAERKQAAVDTVREARKAGVEAYYYHGPTTSSVLVGSFPAEAIHIKDETPRADPGKDLLVIPFKPADIPDEIVDDLGNPNKVVAPKFEILDPVLKATLQKFPHHAINGEERVRRFLEPKTGKYQEVYAESFIVDVREIRRRSILGAGPVTPDAPAAEAPDRSTVAPRPSTPGEGKLKGIK